MRQQIFASYVPSSYPDQVDLRVSHLPFRSAPNGPTTPDPHQHTFDESSFFSAAPQEVFSGPASRGAEGPLETWLMEMPPSTSPGSSRMSMSPSQGIATPPSDSFYSPPYPEHPQLYTYELLEQPQPLRTGSTSHPEWVDNAGNWQQSYSEGDNWSTQPFVAQPWTPSSYDGSAPPHVTSSHTYASNAALTPFMYPAHDQFPTPEIAQTNPAVAISGDALEDEGLRDDEDTSDGDSDWNEEESDYGHAGDLSSGSRSRANTRSSRIQVDRWAVPVNCIQQADTRSWKCDIPDCNTSFQRPEHLRRHVRSKHTDFKPYICKIPECTKPFSRGDNLGDHYWTHLQRGGRAGVNKKMTLSEIKLVLGPREKKVIRKLREKLQKHLEKEKQKKLRAARLAGTERAML
ncbi:hypothetical protein EKO04_006613 [Ascochyta lentis]|uniref:C2H2-type domain-containing protein n=1 Tax=Ascochyta lentis TaxID=205686 RepID=A0A8H7J0E0_9PLEO|nr:hypothetical protein EKO04_006613 [Ascochyta lentis]